MAKDYFTIERRGVTMHYRLSDVNWLRDMLGLDLEETFARSVDIMKDAGTLVTESNGVEITIEERDGVASLRFNNADRGEDEQY